jgi:hypothetical protein
MKPAKIADMEILRSKGESPKDRAAHGRYLKEVERGKSALQLQAVKDQMTTDIRNSWSSRSFTAVNIPSGGFDAVVCNVSYHFHKHGQKYGNIRSYTAAAKKYFERTKRKRFPTARASSNFPKAFTGRPGRLSPLRAE